MMILDMQELVPKTYISKAGPIVCKQDFGVIECEGEGRDGQNFKVMLFLL